MATGTTGDTSLAALAEPIDTSDLAQSEEGQQTDAQQVDPADQEHTEKPEPGPVPYVRFHEKVEETRTERDLRLRAEGELAAERARTAQLSADLDVARRPQGQTATGQPAVPGRYSAEQLEEMIGAGTATRAQVIEYERETARIIARQEAGAAFASQAQVHKLTESVSQYDEFAPGWNKPGTDPHRKASAEFARLISLGMPNSKGTELLALEHAFGKAETLRAANRSRDLTAANRATHQESGSTAQRSEENETGTDKNLTGQLKKNAPDQYAVYQDMVRREQITWPEVEAELKSALSNPYNEALRTQTQALLGKR